MNSADFSGSTLKESDVTVTQGFDPSVRNDIQDPSGFGAFGDTSRDGFLQAVRDIYVAEANRAPKILRDHALRNIPVYLNYIDKGTSDAVALTPPQQMTFDSATLQPLHFELSDIKGLGFMVDTLEITPRLVGKIEHECRHLMTRLGVHMFNVGPNESLIAGLDRHYNPSDRNAYIPKDIRREHAQSTSGLNTPTDFGCIDYSSKAQEALYLAAHCSFQDIHVDQIWKIWELLTELALNNKRFPLQTEVRKAIHEVLQERADPILRSPAFQPMAPGRHAVAFGTPADRPGNKVEFRAFAAQANSVFGLQQVPGGYQYNDVAIRTTDTYSPASQIFFHDHAGTRMPDSQGTGKFEKGAYGTSYAQEARNITAQHGELGKNFLQGVGSMVIQTAELAPVTLLPEK